MRRIAVTMLARTFHAFELDNLAALPGVSARGNRMRDDIGPLLLDGLCIHLQPAISVCQQRRIELPFPGKAHHQRRDAEG